MAGLAGINPGPWCPVYHKTSDRTECSIRRCRFYVNHIILIGEQPESTNSDIPDIDEGLNAISINKPVIRVPRTNYEIGAECNWHCCRFDAPSKLETVAWIESGETETSK